MSTQNITFSYNTQHTFILKKNRKKYPYHATLPGAMISTHKLELPLSRIAFDGPTGVRAIEVLLYRHKYCYKGLLTTNQQFLE